MEPFLKEINHLFSVRCNCTGSLPPWGGNKSSPSKLTHIGTVVPSAGTTHGARAAFALPHPERAASPKTPILPSCSPRPGTGRCWGTKAWPQASSWKDHSGCSSETKETLLEARSANSPSLPPESSSRPPPKGVLPLCLPWGVGAATGILHARKDLKEERKPALWTWKKGYFGWRTQQEGGQSHPREAAGPACSGNEPDEQG